MLIISTIQVSLAAFCRLVLRRKRFLCNSSELEPLCLWAGDPVNMSDATDLYSQWIWEADSNGEATGDGSLMEFAGPAGESEIEKFERLEATASAQQGDAIH